MGHLTECQQFGRVGPVGSGTVGLAIGTTACNKGDEPIPWLALPSTDHPTFVMNMYRLLTADGSDRFEQIGQSWLKHGVAAAQFDECGFGCIPSTGMDEVGVGCSDTYSSYRNAIPCRMGPRSVIHPYTGELPGGDNLGPGGGCGGYISNFPSQNHLNHVHSRISHMVQIRDADLISNLNAGARYFGEAQVITPREFVAGNGNQNNNVSYREYVVDGPDLDGVFTFTGTGETVAESPAFNAWPGVSQTLIEPAPMVDGRAWLVYKASHLGNGLWRYEYALYNMHLERSLGSLSIPVPDDVTLSSIGFHTPLNHAPEPDSDNYGNDPWEVAVTDGTITWSTDTFNVDPLANAVRWGTMYNFRFDANASPQPVDATVGLFKTGATTPAATVGPSSVGPYDCTGNLLPDQCDVRGDIDGDGHLSLADYARAAYCMSGPCIDPPCAGPLYADRCCGLADFDLDGDYDLDDFRAFQLGFADE